MKIKALVSFAGDVTLAQGAVCDCANETLASQLIKAGFAEEVKDAPTDSGEDDLTKAQIKEKLNALGVPYDDRANKAALLAILADAEASAQIKEKLDALGVPYDDRANKAALLAILADAEASQEA